MEFVAVIAVIAVVAVVAVVSFITIITVISVVTVKSCRYDSSSTLVLYGYIPIDDLNDLVYTAFVFTQEQ